MKRASLLPALVLCLGAFAAGAQEVKPEAEAPPPLAIEAVTVAPAAPGPDTLCRLSVEIGNGGDKIASRLHFGVEINGAPVPVYQSQLYLEPLPPGEVTQVALYNFWSTETGRPLPADGKLTVKVVLEEATWVERRVEDGVEIWEPKGEVAGLPVERSVALAMKLPKKPSPPPAADPAQP